MRLPAAVASETAGRAMAVDVRAEAVDVVVVAAADTAEATAVTAAMVDTVAAGEIVANERFTTGSQGHRE